MGYQRFYASTGLVEYLTEGFPLMLHHKTVCINPFLNHFFPRRAKINNCNIPDQNIYIQTLLPVKNILPQYLCNRLQAADKIHPGAGGFIHSLHPRAR
jgi:hypothetical protein